MGRKYRFDRILVVPIYRLVQRLRHGRTPKGAPVILEITPGREGG
jgi:hypothetical protein